MRLFSRLASSRRLARSLGILAAVSFLPLGAVHADPPWQKWRNLSDREKTFLKTVFEGNEAKASEYVQLAGINVNSLAGEPLSAWFYRMAGDDGRPPFIRDPKVQHIVFDVFRQNPNPANVGETYLDRFCHYAPYPPMLSGAQAETAQRPYIDQMAAGFQSLLSHGLRDKVLINSIFQGCINTITTRPYFFEHVLEPMIKAGADINAGQTRSVEIAFRQFNPDLLEGLVRNHANVGLLQANGCPQPTNVYGYIINNIRMSDRERLLRMVRALTSAGLPPTTRTPWAKAGCRSISLYDAAVDAGDIELARQLQEIAGSAGSPRSTPVAEPQPAAAATPSRFGAWTVTVENGRPVAMAKPAKTEGNHLAGLRLECVGGHLEYAPVATRASIPTLWINGMDDNLITLPLTNGRVSGADNAALSKEFLGSEANFKRNGTADWGIDMSIDGPDDTAMQAIKLSGFSQMRSYMLANCRKQG